MYVRPIYREKDGKRHAYWALMKSVRTARGPRSHVVAYLGSLMEAERAGAAHAALGHTTSHQGDLFEQAPQWVEVDASRVRVERLRDFGGPGILFGGGWYGGYAGNRNEAHMRWIPWMTLFRGVLTR